MTLISPSSYLKTINKQQSFLSIQRTQKKVLQNLNTKHIIIKQITMLLRDSQNNLSEAWEINSFFKKIHHHALKDLSEALEQNYHAQKI